MSADVGGPELDFNREWMEGRRRWIASMQGGFDTRRGGGGGGGLCPFPYVSAPSAYLCIRLDDENNAASSDLIDNSIDDRPHCASDWHHDAHTHGSSRGITCHEAEQHHHVANRRHHFCGEHLNLSQVPRTSSCRPECMRETRGPLLTRYEISITAGSEPGRREIYGTVRRSCRKAH